MKNYLIYGSDFAYTCTFEAGVQGAKTCKILSSHTLNNRENIEGQLRVIAGDNTTILTTLDSDNASRNFGDYEAFGRYFSGTKYQCIDCDNDFYTDDELDDVFHFQDFQIDLKIGKYMRFVREIGGIIPSKYHDAYVFVPGIKSHILFTIREKFQGDFRIFQALDFEILNGVPIKYLETKIIDKPFFICGETTSHYWSVMQDWQNSESLIAPYDISLLTNRLIPKLQSQIQDGNLALDGESTSKLVSEIQSFSYRSEMKYESLDEYPTLRALLYIPFYFEDNTLDIENYSYINAYSYRP